MKITPIIKILPYYHFGNGPVDFMTSSVSESMKKQGAYLLQARTATLNGDLSKHFEMKIGSPLYLVRSSGIIGKVPRQAAGKKLTTN